MLQPGGKVGRLPEKGRKKMDVPAESLREGAGMLPGGKKAGMLPGKEQGSLGAEGWVLPGKDQECSGQEKAGMLLEEEQRCSRGKKAGRLSGKEQGCSRVKYTDIPGTEGWDAAGDGGKNMDAPGAGGGSSGEGAGTRSALRGPAPPSSGCAAAERPPRPQAALSFTYTIAPTALH